MMFDTGLAGVVEDQNAQTARHQAQVDAEAEATIAALKAAGVTPIVDKRCSPPSAAGYIETCTYAINVEGSPEYTGRMISGQEGDPTVLARQIASDASLSHSYFGPANQAVMDTAAATAVAAGAVSAEDFYQRQLDQYVQAAAPVERQQQSPRVTETLQETVAGLDLAGFAASNKWLLIGGAAALFLFMGRGR